MDLSSLRYPVVNVHISQCVQGKPHFNLAAAGGEISINSCMNILKHLGYHKTVVIEAKDNYLLEDAKMNLQILKTSLSEETGS